MGEFPSKFYPLAGNALAHAIPYALAPFHSLGPLHGHVQLCFLHLLNEQQKHKTLENYSDSFGTRTSQLITNHCFVLGGSALSCC